MKRRDTTKLADLKLRVEERLRQKIEAAVVQNNRTMTAEMVSRLRDNFDRDRRFHVTNALLDQYWGRIHFAFSVAS
jgi:plasmid maintenance system antidote protein VapI